VAGVNSNLPLADVKTMESITRRSLARTSLALVLLAIAGGMSLLVGVVGMYGVISYTVSQRTREVGIRLALGAPLHGITRLFVRHGLALSSIGAICGVAAALALTRLMGSMLFEVSPADPLTYAAASSALIVAALLGSYLPGAGRHSGARDCRHGIRTSTWHKDWKRDRPAKADIRPVGSIQVKTERRLDREDRATNGAWSRNRSPGPANAREAIRDLPKGLRLSARWLALPQPSRFGMAQIRAGEHKNFLGRV
jgi:hypothetical protein